MRFNHLRCALRQAFEVVSNAKVPQKVCPEPDDHQEPHREKVVGGIIKYVPVDRVASRVVSPASWINKPPPMSERTKSPEELIESAQQRLSLLVGEKQRHEVQLLAIKNVLRSGGRLPNEKYKACCDSQVEHSRKIVILEAELRSVKGEIRRLQSERIKATPRCGDRMEFLRESLRVIELEYRQFADDTTRLPVLRDLAAEFALKIGECLERFTANGS